MKLAAPLLLLFTLATSPAFADPRQFRVLETTPSGLAVAWGIQGQLLDFEAVRAAGVPLDYGKLPLVNYLVDLATNRPLAVIDGGAMSDFHPDERWYESYQLQEFPFEGANLKDEHGDALEVSLALKLDDDANYHDAQSSVLTNAFLVTMPGNESLLEKKLLARCDDCQAQFESLLLARLKKPLHDRYRDDFYMHSFKYSPGRNGTIRFDLDASGCWWAPGSMRAAGELRFTLKDDRIVLGMPAFHLGKVDRQGCTAPKP